MMETKFDQLMYEAGLTAQGSLDEMDAYDREAIQRFAELIARECAILCKIVGFEPVSNASEEYIQGRQMGTEVCYNVIKKHFGVE